MILSNSPLIVGSHNKLNWDKAFAEPRVNYWRVLRRCSVGAVRRFYLNDLSSHRLDATTTTACFLLFFREGRKDYRAAMKRIFISLALVCAAGARADLVTQQQIVTPNYNGVAAMKIKGTKIRMDMYAGQPQALSTITDLNTGETITLMHTQKLYLKSPGQPMKQAKSSGTASKAPVPRATGKTQKVGDYDTELYTWSNDRGITGTVWVAKNYPDYARIRADYAVLDKTAGADTDMTPALSALPGMVVRSQVTGSGQTITLALISAKEAPIDALLFQTPANYKELPQPKPFARQVPKTAPGSSTPKAPGTSTTTTTTTQKLPSW
jgi:hypothetical protein